MGDVSKAISRAFTPAGTGALTSMETQAANQAALGQTDLTKAITDATTASLPVLDNASALAANQAQMKKMLAANGAAWSFGGTPTAAPAVATRVLFGN
jgi:hypothetical protein